ncbi:protein kinase [Streptomyces sp. NPDC012888]|uniref:protein kinase domain-containing protein n=1 Tax=Streptomyces sp. NPDC012888 TaxID=3364855 RepID=UPI00368D8AFB
MLGERYLLTRPLGAGGHGEVWQAQDRELSRPVALKLLRADVSGHEAEKRFRREAVITAGLRHPGLVVVHDIGRDHGRTFIVMELLDGTDLAHTLRGAPAGLPVPQVLDVARQALEALAAAHDRGIVHRDLKPANLFLQEDGRVKVCDFGIAHSAEFTKGLTPPDRVMGTFDYLAPEQCLAGRVDARTDLYSFGCTLYALLTGAPPFAGGHPASRMVRHVQEPPRPLRSLRPALPAALDDLVLALLAKDPAQRPPTARDVVRALTRPDPSPTRFTTGRAALPPREGGPPRTYGPGHLLAGRYEFLQDIGLRGPGDAWRALDRPLAREVTVRVLDRDASARLDWRRFDHQTRVGARVPHPALAVVHDTGREAGRAYTVGEFVAGGDLYGVLARSTGGLPLREVFELSWQIADALRAAHEDTTAHLGLTWRTVLRQPDGRIKICDFGITAAGGADGASGGGPFTAPEQWHRPPGDARSDLYALGCLLYALLTAHPPFRDADPDRLRRRHLTQPAPPLGTIRPGLPPELAELASALLAKEPADRPSATDALAVLAPLNPPRGEQPPYRAPVRGELGLPYRVTGPSWTRGYHPGVDFLVPTGTPVHAVAAGRVESAGWAGSYGYEVVLRHPDGFHTQYAHLMSLSVRAGQHVSAGQRIARSGCTGNASSPHLHFEVRTGPGPGSDVDPVAYLRSRGVHLG